MVSSSSSSSFRASLPSIFFAYEFLNLPCTTRGRRELEKERRWKQMRFETRRWAWTGGGRAEAESRSSFVVYRIVAQESRGAEPE
ncbi:hypothetical protein U1Q18_048060 [Sarracenia purpurea var. burkii]